MSQKRRQKKRLNETLFEMENCPHEIHYVCWWEQFSMLIYNVYKKKKIDPFGNVLLSKIMQISLLFATNQQHQFNAN